MHPRIAFPNTKKWDLFTRMNEDEDEGGKHEKMQKGTITLTKLLLIKISDDLAVKEIITDHQAIRREMH